MKDTDYYRGLWRDNARPAGETLKPRDWFHARVLDRLLPLRAEDRIEVIRDLLAGTSGRWLDIGCWGGDLVELLDIKTRFSEIHGVDILEESVARARERGLLAVRCNLNAEGLPHPDVMFDVVTCIAVIGQVFDPYGVLAEIRRVLRPGGVLILHVPNAGSLSNRLRLLFGRLPVTSRAAGWDGGQLHYFTAHAVHAFLTEGGFRVAAVRATGASRPLRDLRPSLLSGTLTFKAIRL